MPIDYAKQTFTKPDLSSIVDEAIEFFAESSVHDLPPPDPFHGGGVYALYYFGPNPYYAPLEQANQGELIHPIYIGKAIPEGGRIGFSTAARTRKLYVRLMEHTRSIQAATTNLSLKDFKSRFMIMDATTMDLIVPVEAELIRRYRPVWNAVGGFGNHVVGVNRQGGRRADWDVLHPGRSGAALSEIEEERLEGILDRIRRHFQTSGLS